MKDLRTRALWNVCLLSSVVGACNGQVHNLGDEAAAGRTNANQTGGAASTGGTVAVGNGTGATGGSLLTPYPLAPTVPVDPDCRCISPDSICNAANQCVPRCDSKGDCALWLTNRAVKSLYVEGSTLFYAVTNTADAAGNPAADAQLYRVDYPNGAPTLIAAGLDEPVEILGRYKGATYLRISRNSTYTRVVQVTDGGSVSNVGALDSSSGRMNGHWLVLNTNKVVQVVDLDSGLPARTLADLSNSEGSVLESAILEDYVWYHRIGPSNACYVPLSNLDAPATCSDYNPLTAEVGAVGGNTLYVKDGVTNLVASYDVTGQYLLRLLATGMSYGGELAYSRGWLYALVTPSDVSESRLVRFPSNVGRLPQDILPHQLSPALNLSSGTNGGYAVASDAVYWYHAATNPNVGQYIFRAPLPAPPCDDSLPCEEPNRICTGGFCAPTP